MAYLNYTELELQALFDFYGNKCLVCGSPEITRDHVVPVVFGGRDVLENIQPLCKPCNSRKNNKTIDYRPVPYPVISAGKQSVSIRLREIATSKGLNMNQVQRRTGLTMGVVRRYWDNDTSSVDLYAIDRLCELLACEPGDLIRRVPPHA